MLDVYIIHLFYYILFFLYTFFCFFYALFFQLYMYKYLFPSLYSGALSRVVLQMWKPSELNTFTAASPNIGIVMARLMLVLWLRDHVLQCLHSKSRLFSSSVIYNNRSLKIQILGTSEF